MYSFSQTRAISRMYFLRGSPERLDLRDRRDEVAGVDDRDAQRREPLAEAGDAERRRPHVDAAAVAAEIERHADDVNGPRLARSRITHEPRATRFDASR